VAAEAPRRSATCPGAEQESFREGLSPSRSRVSAAGTIGASARMQGKHPCGWKRAHPAGKSVPGLIARRSARRAIAEGKAPHRCRDIAGAHDASSREGATASFETVGNDPVQFERSGINAAPADGVGFLDAGDDPHHRNARRLVS